MLIGILLIFCVYIGITYFVPVLNRFYGLIWKDPTMLQRADVAHRINELCVDGDKTPETVTALAASEFHCSEEELLDVMGAACSQEMVALMRGQKVNPMRMFSRAMEARMKRGAGPRRGRPGG